MPKIVDHDARREFIARISAEIIAEQGLEQATIREIAARTGFSKGVVEHYFDDKDHVISMALSWVNERYFQREQRATAGRTGLDALHARLCCVMPISREALQEWKIRLRFWSLAAIHTELQAAQSERLQVTRQRFERDIGEAVVLGDVPDGVDIPATANLIAHLVSGVSCHALIAPKVYHRRYLRAVADEVVEDLRDGRVAQVKAVPRKLA